jgi:CheY-like chemotaxis protein
MSDIEITEAPEVVLNPHHILVVEDNDFVRTQIKMFLKGDAYIVHEAADGSAAQTWLATNKADLIIVDVYMEPMGGFEFMRLLRGKGHETPVVLVTGDQNHDLLEQSNRLGVASVLIKPVKKDRLVTMVQRLIARQGGNR